MSRQFVYENWLNQSDGQLTPARLFSGPAVHGWEQKGKIGQEGIHALPEAGVWTSRFWKDVNVLSRSFLASIPGRKRPGQSSLPLPTAIRKKAGITGR